MSDTLEATLVLASIAFAVFLLGVVVGAAIGNWWALLIAPLFGAIVGVLLARDPGHSTWESKWMLWAYLLVIGTPFVFGGAVAGVAMRKKWKRNSEKPVELHD
jgi:energy-coupling factor transporter transmembrane protein EcfT